MPNPSAAPAEVPSQDPAELVRVRDEDTGYKLTVRRDQVHLGKYAVLDEDAALNGVPLGVDYGDDEVAPEAVSTQKTSAKTSAGSTASQTTTEKGSD